MQALHHMEINNPCNILDNCPIHKKEDINSMSSFFVYDYKYLPQYCPLLNPIEKIIKDVKKNKKSQFADTLRSRILNIELLPKGSRSHERFRLLNKALHYSIDSQKKKTIKTNFNSMMAKLPASLGEITIAGCPSFERA